MTETSEHDLYYDQVAHWFSSNGWSIHAFQSEAWSSVEAQAQGIVNAPTGSGKTYALILPILRAIAESGSPSLQAIWISPVRALTQEILMATERAIDALGLDIYVDIRTGDTSMTKRRQQRHAPPQILITTPESLHVMLSAKDYPHYLDTVRYVVADEWHELLGSKRGVQVELALSRLRGLNDQLLAWGISATIGNLDQALQVLLGHGQEGIILRHPVMKMYEVVTVLPDDIESMPWTGHIGIHLLQKVLPIIYQAQSTLIFTNTRSQCEMWYQRLLEVDPALAGIMAMHHSALSEDIRHWVENGLYHGHLKVVVCTSSLDLGVDFKPVESVIQIGSPKGVARFMQRAGRSGHSPGAVSRIYFVPTHALEIIEGSALRIALQNQIVETRTPLIRCFDVLVQYLLTLAAATGFRPEIIYDEIRSTYCFSSVTSEEWNWLIQFIVHGSQSLHAYDEYVKVGYDAQGLLRIKNRSIAHRHRLSIGTIISDQAMRIRYVSGSVIGTVEEGFISHLQVGDVFWFGGRSLQLVRIKGDDVLVERSSSTKGKIPSWQGGRMPLSSEMSIVLRDLIDGCQTRYADQIELIRLKPLLDLQLKRSHIPSMNELLIERVHTEDGHHLFIYPFEGRIVHEGLGGLLAYRISRQRPNSFSIAMNDYGLELLTDKEVDLATAIADGLFSTEGLRDDIAASINKVEMARRHFRDIAGISGLIFQGFPGRLKRGKHLQSSSALLFNIFHEYEPDNLLYLQAYEEAALIQYEEQRLREVLNRIAHQKIVLKTMENPSPFSFPIMVDRLRERFTNETISMRISRMQIMDD